MTTGRTIIPLPSESDAESATGKTGVHNFALIGAAGFVAPRHMQAIKDTAQNLVAAVDPHDSVGILDRHFPDARFFTEIERFDRFLEKQRRHSADGPVDFVSICTPNYLHDAHVRLALRVGASAICEKPLVINPWNLDQLLELEQEYPGRVCNVLQLRLHPGVQALQASLASESNKSRRQVDLTYVTRRGAWYHTSWKGAAEKSGGLAMNIGIHFFDLLTWLFGPVERNSVHWASDARMGGFLRLQEADVRWFLSVDADDLPASVRREGGYAYRSLRVDGEEVDLSAGFNDLHTRVYSEILAGRGFGIEDARPSIDLVHSIRTSDPVASTYQAHPFLTGQKAA